MLKPNESKRDWFLFHMTPSGMAQAAKETPAADSDSAKRIALIVLGGVLAVGVLLAAYAGV